MTAPTLPSYLGFEATVIPILLYTGTTFSQTISPSGTGVFPTGTTVQLVLTSPGGAALGTWSATVTPTTATWSVANTIADLIPVNTRYLITVTFLTTPVTTFPWFTGVVLRPKF
ncbi:LtfC-like domain-containing protein [Nocardia sp. NBC_01327]|uniref:LtfC-like domain-containing protein n=1 Tax=Nocardia sp. NBC_01327 TaxID=2903593 RepID=UPI002E11E497|nr:hypothetical protein OG326_23910 [Nocardia sp. NBC_01327]